MTYKKRPVDPDLDPKFTPPAAKKPRAKRAKAEKPPLGPVLPRPLHVFHLHNSGEGKISLLLFSVAQNLEIVAEHQWNLPSVAEILDVFLDEVAMRSEHDCGLLLFIHVALMSDPEVQKFMSTPRTFPIGFFQVEDGVDWVAQFKDRLPILLSTVREHAEGGPPGSDIVEEIRKVGDRTAAKLTAFESGVKKWQANVDRSVARQVQIMATTLTAISDILDVLTPNNPGAVARIRRFIEQKIQDLRIDAAAEPHR